MMVSMEGEGTAKRFNSMFKLTHVENMVLEGNRGKQVVGLRSYY